jgi:acyl carrier protein
MSQDSIIDNLKTIIVDDLDANISREEINQDTLLFEGGLGLDSVSLVELISLVEKKFSIKFSDSELNPESFSTLTVLSDVVANKQAS